MTNISHGAHRRNFAKQQWKKRGAHYLVIVHVDLRRQHPLLEQPWGLLALCRRTLGSKRHVTRIRNWPDDMYSKNRISACVWRFIRLTRDRTAESVTRDQNIRRDPGQGNIHLPCLADTSRIGDRFISRQYSAVENMWWPCMQTKNATYSSLFLTSHLNLKLAREDYWYIPGSGHTVGWEPAIVPRSQTHARPISSLKKQIPITIKATWATRNYILIIRTRLDLLNSKKVQVPVPIPQQMAQDSIYGFKTGR